MTVLIHSSLANACMLIGFADISKAQFRRRPCVESNLAIKGSTEMRHKCGKYLFVGSVIDWIDNPPCVLDNP